MRLMLQIQPQRNQIDFHDSKIPLICTDAEATLLLYTVAVRLNYLMMQFLQISDERLPVQQQQLCQWSSRGNTLDSHQCNLRGHWFDSQ